MLLIYTAHIMDPYTGLDGLRDILIDDNEMCIRDRYRSFASGVRRGVADAA